MIPRGEVAKDTLDWRETSVCPDSGALVEGLKLWLHVIDRYSTDRSVATRSYVCLGLCYNPRYLHVQANYGSPPEPSLNPLASSNEDNAIGNFSTFFRVRTEGYKHMSRLKLKKAWPGCVFRRSLVRGFVS